MFHGIMFSPWTEDGKANLDGQKWVCVPVSYDFLVSMMMRGNKITSAETIEGVPSNAIYKGSFYDKIKLEAYLVFEHDSFQKLKIGDFIPTMRVVIRKINP